MDFKATSKYLTRKLLTDTKWLRKPNEDLPENIDDKPQRYPRSLPSYCRICQRQTIHERVSSDRAGAWYLCFNCMINHGGDR